MKIRYAFYELEANHSLNAASSVVKRKGALLKVIFNADMIGYADCHPWPELGDLDIQQQLSYLAQEKYTPLTRSAIEFALVDAKNRFHGKSAFAQSCIPSSHFLVTDIFDLSPKSVQKIIEQGFTHIKLKLGRHLKNEIERLHILFLNMPLKLRLDFNEKLCFHTFLDFLQQIQKMKKQIDFIEDPFPFHLEDWTAIQKEGWILACDRQVQEAAHQPEAAFILIVKPALQSFAEWRQWIDQKCIVTSYLGHPVGQVAAAYVAAKIDPDCFCVHGLLSHHVYQRNSFSHHLNWKSPSFTLPSGFGLGFDNELDQLNWKSL